MITKHPTLEKLLTNKKVVIVGPSPHLVDTGLGAVIDEYDVVCRVNDVIPLPYLRPDYGSRSDILFHNMGTLWLPGLVEKINCGDTHQHWETLKLVVCPTIKATGDQNDYLNWSNDYISDVVKNFESVNDCGVPFYWVGVKDYKTLWSKVGVEPNCGILSIMLLLSYDIKELFVTGFSFYAQGTQRGDVYCEGHWPSAVPESKTYGQGHSQHRQREIFKSFCGADDRIKIDSYMNTLLSLDYSNLVELH